MLGLVSDFSERATPRELRFGGVFRCRAVEVPVGKLQPALPVKIGHVVAAMANVIADRAVEDRLVDRRHLRDGQASAAEQTIHWIGSAGREELAARVGPGVVHGAGNVNRPRGNERNQHVLVHRQIVDAIGELFQIAAEPMGKDIDDGFQRLAETAARQRGAAAARVVRNYQRETLVLAPAQRAVLPSREWPVTATCFASTCGSLCR